MLDAVHQLPALIASQEGLKLVMSFGLAMLEFGSCSAALSAVAAVKPGDSLRLAVPALLFVLQNAVCPSSVKFLKQHSIYELHEMISTHCSHSMQLKHIFITEHFHKFAIPFFQFHTFFLQPILPDLKAMQLATVHLPAALFQVMWQGKTFLSQKQ